MKSQSLIAYPVIEYYHKYKTEFVLPLTDHQYYIVPEVRQIENEDEYYRLKRSTYQHISKELIQNQTNDKKRN